MKNLLFLVLFIASTLSVFAEDTIDSITTTDGMVYKSVTIMSTDPAGIHIVHEGGAASIPFSKLPVDIQKKYNYDPEKARAFIKAEAAKAQAVKAAEAAKAKQKAAEDHLKSLQFIVIGSVLQKPSDGLLVDCVRFTPGVVYDPKEIFGQVFIKNYEKYNKAVVGDEINVTVYEDGTYSYKDESGTAQTVHAYNTKLPEPAPAQSPPATQSPSPSSK